MNSARALLGVYVPGRTPWHRMAVGWKYLVFLALTAPAVVSEEPAVVLGTLALTMVLVLTTRAPLRLAWGLPAGIVVLLGALAAFQVATGNPAVAVKVAGTTLVALYAFRIVLLTTPMPALIDALVAFVTPLRRFGVDPERVGIAVAVLVRSVPYVVASFGDVRDAARARGLQRNPLASVTPVVIAAVAYARTAGDALMARRLGDADA